MTRDGKRVEYAIFNDGHLLGFGPTPKAAWHAARERAFADALTR
jgi:hypothetical protein